MKIGKNKLSEYVTPSRGIPSPCLKHALSYTYGQTLRTDRRVRVDMTLIT